MYKASCSHNHPEAAATLSNRNDTLPPPASPQCSSYIALSLVGRNLEVQRQQAAQHFTAGDRADGEAHLAALVGVEAVARVEVGPAVAREDGVVHRNVQLAQAGNIGVHARGVVE